ncbi:ABC transporter substrate-binding protein [Sulfuritalea sp.]|jgi:branched-chain amino acid transport system substrate-binding protein|uniref:ABC transporter substrate-binding protein n=1 Tax=Sulfuritalea sp. TaxID=2480090 RepID=UPI001AD11936|nr:ABC transporter substrate-binding protein [Sulfuritalea sp.]MBN8476891.1 ABC transporter substrate-binding protein [Sulfuritalea sp.]
MKKLLAVLTLALVTTSVAAQIKVGVTLAATGPAASLGIPEKNVFALVPKTLGGMAVEIILLDDATDPSAAVKNTHKLINDNVDVIIGSSITPSTLAMVDVVAEKQTPLIALAASSRIVEPMDAKRAWVFKIPQNDSLVAGGIVEHMVKSGIKTVAYIGFSDAYGEGWHTEFSKLAEAAGIKLIAKEVYGRADTSVTAQALKLVSANPEAILIGAAGTPGVLPQATLIERGYKGKIYQTHGVANGDFIRVGGKQVEGALLPVGPNLVAEQLPDSHPSKKAGLEFVQKYEGAHGKGSRSLFAALAWDAWLVLDGAATRAVKKAKPGTPEFRKALRDELEATKNLVASTGVYNYSPTDHAGLDSRARVMVRIENGTWKLVQ